MMGVHAALDDEFGETAHQAPTLGALWCPV